MLNIIMIIWALHSAYDRLNYRTFRAETERQWKVKDLSESFLRKGNNFRIWGDSRRVTQLIVSFVWCYRIWSALHSEFSVDVWLRLRCVDTKLRKKLFLKGKKGIKSSHCQSWRNVSFFWGLANRIWCYTLNINIRQFPGQLYMSAK